MMFTKGTKKMNKSQELIEELGVQNEDAKAVVKAFASKAEKMMKDVRKGGDEDLEDVLNPLTQFVSRAKKY